MRHLAFSSLAASVLVASAFGTLACGSSKSSSAGSTMPGPPGVHLTGIVPTPSPVDASCKNVLKGPYSSSLPTPANVVVTGDDYSARVQWGGDLTGDGTNPTGVSGYRVCWGPAGSPPIYGGLFVERIGQLYGVQNGNPFEAYVQSVDALGNVSAPSAAVQFSGDSTRVEAIRQKMTGFFDDFNGKSMPFDDKKWNTAYSFCNDAVVNGSFLQDNHAINMIGNHSFLPGSVLGCDRDQNINRAREVFDFTGREGLITFDLDGTDGNRNTWYVDVFPYEGHASDLIDITGHVSFDPGLGHPGRFLRFSMQGNQLMVNRYDSGGNPLQLFKTDITYTFPNARYVLGVLRHWELRVAKDHASITIDGQKVLDAPGLGLDFEKGIVTWDQFNYNPQKIGRPWVSLNFDNFGFDGPKSAPAVHNYKVSLDGNDALALGNVSMTPTPDAASTITIPDDITAAKTARFYYTIQNDNYSWASTDGFSINGQPFPIPMPTSPTGITIANDLIDSYRAFAVVTEIPTAMLVQGDNAIDFHAQMTRVRNLHIELDYDSADAAYTPPVTILPSPAMPVTPLIGPTMIVSRINDKVNDVYTDSVSFRLNTNNVSGKVTIALKIDNFRPLLASGRNLGVSKADLLIDQKVFATLRTDAGSPAPAVSDLAFDVDTTKLSNGTHEVFGVAYDAAGTTGRPGYLDPEKNENGVDPTQYAPIIINVQN